MSVSRSLRFQILRRDDHKCRYCGRAAPEVKLTVDHVIPEALGGTDEPGNLVTACADCNGGKSATPPDATHVAQVADDAVRWAHAIQVAADRMLADFEARERDLEEFATYWEGFKFGSGYTVTLPADWSGSIERILTAGLPLAVLLRCVDGAMAAKNVQFKNKFRYMAGMAWKRIGVLQESAHLALGVPLVSTPALDVSRTEQWASELVGPYLGERGFQEAVTAAEAAIAVQEDDDESSRDVYLRVAEDYLAKLDGEHWYMRMALIAVFNQLPQPIRQRYFFTAGLSVAEPEALAGTDLDAGVLSKLVQYQAEGYAQAYLDSLPKAERVEWVRRAAATFKARVREEDLQRITECAATWARDEASAHGEAA